MILSDREIRAAVDRGAIRITPVPAPAAWTSTAVDLHLGRTFRRWRLRSGGGLNTEFRPSDPEFNFQQLSQDHTEAVTIPDDGLPLAPNEFILAWAVERVCLPHSSRLAARVEGKSSLARLGLGVHVTAPTIHAGFGVKPGAPEYQGSTLQLEMWHVGPVPIRLTPHMPICQLIVEEVHGTPEKGYSGMFAVQGETV